MSTLASDQFSGFSAETLGFLRGLATNNNKTWFSLRGGGTGYCPNFIFQYGVLRIFCQQVKLNIFS